MTGGVENIERIDHPGHAVVKAVTDRLNPWEAHKDVRTITQQLQTVYI
jgi:hypothetical protein